ncbi:Sal family ABC-F type ribosomal protection protein [Mammaliicoccus sciuri]|uniref:ABC-F type ribosomal protection protein Sal(A) n=1 Tax=Mammaliicoccus sciuri TaxID=1296 RepID=UPI0019D3349C|nr:ABC-F type ribosomal protection protein Sal(A) [Mammaliicoccus sciuri]MCD8770933.1 Sal family ABC-F type ribosomal protection protein [Mammaliicoccus sciuri]MCJ1758410.1 Sal family ABC-F type ribosomal protection protein [Mammaliicoccus sciuri]MEB7817589.1 Sal family ABC-F type ribosomal protection protein [Mammaliicoccus sciuri]QSN68931.1 Sal family ABC-F type ribosomal protection protein [Mammaliicoccus sciuri]UIU23676.1 Sal family ABC-F type ribosomal protection protein [Mammaliicoccus s
MLFLFEEKALEVEHKVLIPELTFSIEDHEHLAIVGVNGVGKSTLLKVIHQDQSVDSAMMEQDLTPYYDCTVMDYIIESYPEIAKIRLQLNHTDMINKYIELDGYLIEGEIVTEAKKLGIKEEQLEQKISTLSGGEQTKVSFLKVKMSKASLLLIDEPTNHMDLEMKEWLTKAFKLEQRAILFVSHDRTFLNETPDAILELSTDGAKKYIGQYDKYKQQKDIEHETLKLQYEKQQKEQAAIEETIKKYKAWYQKAAQSASVRSPYQQKQLSKLAKRFKSKENQLNRKLDQEHIANPDKKEKAFSIQHHDFKSHYLVQFNHVSFSYDNRTIFDDVSFYIKRNQNVIVEGRNGTGKSTLIKLILGELEPTKGNITVHPELEIGYFSQDFENLNMHHTVLDEILVIPEMKEADARTILASFYFDKDRINDVVETLSMGEKCRLQFVKLYFSNPHIMILDEPTNYFDIGMQEKIIQLIQSFQGSVLIVSHDDYFKSQIKDQTWTIKNHQMTHENVQVKDPINTESMKHQLKELEQYTDERNRETEF